MIKYVSAIFLLYVHGISVNRNEVNKYEETYQKNAGSFSGFLISRSFWRIPPQQIFAQTPEQKQPSVAEKTTTSITFTTENDLEYAIQTEKPDTDEETKETSQETDKAKDMVWT